MSRNDGLKNLGVEPTEEIMELEHSMGELISAAGQLRDLQVNMQASVDSLREQYFKLQEANDKHEWMAENKFIRLELLELQEMLVRAGYVDPEEAEKFSSAQPQEVRMERASRIFYEYVQNFAPELISPQSEQFVEAARASVDERAPPKQTVPLDETHDKISLASLSQSLVGLSRQALSHRREPNGKDYLHSYYESLALEQEKMMESDESPLKGMAHVLQATTVQMERDYLRAYAIFDKEVEKMKPRMFKLIDETKDDVEGLLHALLGLSSCKIEAPEKR